MSEPMTDAGLCEFWRERAQKAEAECDALRDERDKAEHETGKAYIECDALRADAERYRWLRDPANAYRDEWNYFGLYSSAAEIDAVIDAARAALKEAK